ncbi:MAG: phosphoglycerate dehydrogenase [Bacteroidetes bacterium]|nr:phosphoglycerate dehydrogenase [Bacteroidota bacterium]
MKVLIVDEMHDSIVQMPAELGLEVDYFPNISIEEVKAKVADYEGLIIRSKFFIDEDFLKNAPKLRFIGRAGAGLDLIDIEACRVRNIEIFAANEGNRVAVAEHLIGMILSLFNKICIANPEVKAGVWKREENRGEELFGKTVGIIGYGNNGEATASRLVAFGCKVLAYDKYRYGFGNQYLKESTLDEIFRETDILSLHIPLTTETQNWVNAAFFEKFSKPFYFCNIARGEIVVLHDLVDALKSGKIKGACLDVLENEKLSKLTESQKVDFEYLSNHQAVIMTPHIAGWTFESYKRINQVLKDKIARFLDIV